MVIPLRDFENVKLDLVIETKNKLFIFFCLIFHK